ncbi:MAG: SURF1 family protein [Actinomycetota bacterium]|nr:SURF1 family protein [Actinomycetota bacterium]
MDGTVRGRPFWLRGRWLVGHVLVAVLVVTFASFGFWQLRRLDERKTQNAIIESRSSLPLQPIDEVVPDDAGFDDTEGLAYRRATARGTYDGDASVLVRSRALDGRPGFWVLTPLRLDSGEALVVNRGFAPFTADPAEALAATRPPPGEVEVTGLLLATQERQGIGPTDPPDGELSEITRVDLARLQQQYSVELKPLYLQLQAQTPPVGALPVPLPPPEQSEGSHLAYAFQWFSFAAVGAIGWPVLLRHTGRERARGSWPVDGASPPTDGSSDGIDTAARREAVPSS